ncbi:MAG: Dodecaprenyl-phosphate galacturonate synthase [Gammaproteobacteria bacterium]|nr:Dodecaprenyl-phosphate galacturonate synthase [Gammaproteobacteria bacterium]
MSISVVVPVRNEAKNIHPLVEEIFSVLAGRIEFEMIYVDDGSSDDTLQNLRDEQRGRAGKLRILTHDSVCGQSTAIHSGVQAAAYPWIVTLDGDGQNDPVDILKLLESVRAAGSKNILIVGHRVERHDTWLRRLSSRVANVVRGFMLRDKTPDTGCGLKVFPRELFLQLPYFDHMHRFLPALVLRQGGRILSVPVSHRARGQGLSKYGLHNRLWAGVVDMFGVAWLQWRYQRSADVKEVTRDEL